MSKKNLKPTYTKSMDKPSKLHTTDPLQVSLTHLIQFHLPRLQHLVKAALLFRQVLQIQNFLVISIISNARYNNFLLVFLFLYLVNLLVLLSPLNQVLYINIEMPINSIYFYLIYIITK